MKLAVFSDTHGRTAGMLSAAKRIRPDVFVHLGDHIRDSLELAHEFPDTPLYAVAGNCDFSSKEPDRMTFLIGTTTVFATHGHGYAVKYTMEPLLNAGHFAEAERFGRLKDAHCLRVVQRYAAHVHTRHIL